MAQPTIAGSGVAVCGPSVGWQLVANTVGPSAFSAAALTNSIPLFQLPPGGVLHGIKIKHSQSFSGGVISAYTISVGDVGNAVRFASAYDVFQAVTSTAFQLSSNFVGEDDVSPVQIYATATSVGANLSAATAGLVNIWALLSMIPQRT